MRWPISLLVRTLGRMSFQCGHGKHGVKKPTVEDHSFRGIGELDVFLRLGRLQIALRFAQLRQPFVCLLPLFKQLGVS
jgi:hypothetical protein